MDSVAPKEAEEGEDAKDEEEGEDASEASEASEPASEDEEEAAFLPPLRETTPVPPRPPDAWAPPGISAGEISASKKDSSPVVGAFASAFEAVRADLLATDARLPGVSDGASLGGGADGRAMCLARGSKRGAAWRAFVARATTPRTSPWRRRPGARARARVALPAWLPWSPAAPALRAAETGERRHAKAALGAVAARLAALKRAVQWPKRAREEAAPAAEPQPKLTREERGSRRAAAAAAAAVAAAIAASEADMEVDAAKAAERDAAGDDAEIDANVLSG